MRRNRISTLFLVLMLIAIGFIYYEDLRWLYYKHTKTRWLIDPVYSSQRKIDDEQIETFQEPIQGRYYNKWIVVLSENGLTEQIKYMNDALNGWSLLVVGDTQSPPYDNLTYKNVIYLSIREQKMLANEYSIFDTQFPLTSHTRKLVGYLYAIKRGARYIYETQDSFKPMDGMYQFRYRQMTGLQLNCNPKSAQFVNVLAHFTSQVQDCQEGYKVYSGRVPFIQQGLFTDNTIDSNLPPLVLSNNEYALFDSKNTLFHHEAFALLPYPIDVHDREEADMIRSLIATRLLREVDSTVGFVAGNVNGSLNTDYKRTSQRQKIADRVNKWYCSSSSELKVCLIECVQALIKVKLLGAQNLKFYKSWVRDLDKIKYKWPDIGRLADRRVDKQPVVYFKQSIMSKEDQIETVEAACSVTLKPDVKLAQIDNLVLLTSASSVKELENIDKIWRAHFKYIIVCYTGRQKLLFDYKFTIILSLKGSFTSCIKTAKRIGLRRHSFILAKDISNFRFWSNQVSFQTLSYELDDKHLDTGFYLIRNLVANGIRLIVFDQKDKSDICSQYKASKSDYIPQGLNKALDELTWHQNDLVGESCRNLQVKHIWMPDFHDGPRADLTAVLGHLGQVVLLANGKGMSSPFPEAIRLGKLITRISTFVYRYSRVDRRELGPESVVADNFNYYKSDPDFQQADYVICSFLATMCEAFIPLNKTIIINPAHRYNIGRCRTDSWLKLNENLDKLKQKSKLVLGAMSRYDEEYMFHYTGMRQYRLYAYAGYYSKNVFYNPIKPEILVGPANGLGSKGPWFLDQFNKIPDIKFAPIRTLYKRYTLQQLASHPAIILLPYASMSYSIVDFYAINLPIFIPSIELLTKHKNVEDRSIRLGAYCGETAAEIEPNSESPHEFNPNDDSDDPYSYWLQYADYFQWPHVTVFYSIDDLAHKLRTLDLRKISEGMKHFNSIKEANMLDNWCRILKRDTRHSTIPESYSKALDYFGISQIQVGFN